MKQPTASARLPRAKTNRLTQTVVGGVAGVCVLRNARDIIPLICGHYLRMGFGHLAFVDDGSSDGTWEFLANLARRTTRVSVKRICSDQFNQDLLVTEVANALIAAGYQIIVPFDSDEFWLAEALTLEGRLAVKPEIVVHGRWVNFVQHRRCRIPQPFDLFAITYRAPALADASKSSVTGLLRPFVSLEVRKIAFKSKGAVAVDPGQHNLLRGPKTQCDKTLEILHLPLRSPREIQKRALDYEPRRAKVRKDSSQSWQSLFFRQMFLDGRAAEIWAANSADSQGNLDVFGRPQKVTRDDRLRRILILAAMHLLVFYRTWPL